MPRTRQSKPTDVPDAVLDHFAGPARVMTATEVEEAIRRYKKALLERALGAELTHHLGYPPGAKPDAVARRPRPFSRMTGRWTSTCRGIVRGRSSRC